MAELPDDDAAARRRRVSVAGHTGDVAAARSDWADILDRWGVTVVAVAADAEDLLPFMEAHPQWKLLHEDEEGAVYQLVG